MRFWFTADCHFGHANIIKYCNRPFKNVQEMDTAIIAKWNARVKPEDTVFHLGDFCFKNTLGGKEGEGGLDRPSFYEKQLNGKIVFLKGNHDHNNSTKAIIDCMMLDYGGKDIFCVHIPPENLHAVPDHTDLILSGHVHGAWKGKVLTFPVERDPIAVVNVGVDVWGFQPVDINEIHAYMVELLKKNKLLAP